MKASFGTFSLYRAVKPKNRWKIPGEVEYDPNWVGYFFLGEKKPMVRTAKLYPVCPRCKAIEQGKDPVKERPDCECHRGAAKWAKLFLNTQLELMRRGEMDKLQALQGPAKWTPVAEVLKVYRERGPGDRVQRLNYLDAIWEQTTGKPTSRLQWDDLTGDLLRDWAELRQEAGRRGWLGVSAGKNMPPNGWEKLRALKVQNRLPALDTKTVAEWNTTIVGYVASVKSILGNGARDKELRGLRIPPLESFQAVRLKGELPTPEGHKEIPEKVLEEIERQLPQLLKDDPAAWTFFGICDESGLRPVSVCRLSKSDLKMLSAAEAATVKAQMAKEWRVKEDELCEFGALLAVGAAKNGNPITTPLSAAVAAQALLLGDPDSKAAEARAHLEKVKRLMQEHLAAHGEADTSVDWRRLVGNAEKKLRRAQALLGGGVDKTYNRLNAWLRKCGVEGNQAAYLLRHRKGQAMRQFGGKTAVSAALGHKGEAMADRYSSELRVVPAVFPGRKSREDAA